MNGPTGVEVIGMMANEASSYAREAGYRRVEAAQIIKRWVADPSPSDPPMTVEQMSEIVTDLVAAVRVLSGLPPYDVPRDKWGRDYY